MFEQAFKNIDDVLWKEAGCTTELDYTEQTSWLLFLKYLDGLEQDIADEAACSIEHCNRGDIVKSCGSRHRRAMQSRPLHPRSRSARLSRSFISNCPTIESNLTRRAAVHFRPDFGQRVRSSPKIPLMLRR